MTKTLYETVKDFYEAAAGHPEAAKYLVGKPGRLYAGRTYQFEIENEDPFYIEIEEGRLSVKKGVTPKNSWLERVDFQVDRETLLGVIQARLHLVDVFDDGRWKVSVNEHWRGSHIPVLTRLGQDIVKMKAVEQLA